jgi:hypothetical protein
MYARRVTLSTVFSVLAILTGGSAQSTEIADPSFSTCTGINCSSVVLGAVVNAYTGLAKPWTAEVRASAGRCLRLEVSQQVDDLEIVAVAPDGSVYRNDDSIGLRPLVKINSTLNGFYTVQIAQYAGTVSENAFTLTYGIYSLNNPNCSSPTTPELTRVARKISAQWD